MDYFSKIRHYFFGGIYIYKLSRNKKPYMRVCVCCDVEEIKINGKWVKVL